MKTNASATSCASVLMWRAGKGLQIQLAPRCMAFQGEATISPMTSQRAGSTSLQQITSPGVSWRLMEKTGTQVSRCVLTC